MLKLFIPVFIIVSTFACGGADDAGREGDAAGSALRVVVERPKAADREQTMVLPGTLEPWEVARLYARVTGYLDSVAVDIGDEVEKGAALARIVVPEMDAQLQRARAEVASAKAELDRARAELKLAELTHTRLESLRERERGAVPQQDVDAAGANADVAGAKVAVARAHVAAARAEVDRLEAMSGFAELRAPFAGRVTRRVLHPGALVREGTSSDAMPVLEVARTDTLRLVFAVPESLVPYLRVDGPATVRLHAFPRTEIAARIARSAGALDPETRSMRVEIDLDNPTDELKPGMFASVALTVATDEAGLSLSSRAVRGRGADRYVLVVSEGVLSRRSVTVASDDGRRALVVAGLAATEVVMVAGSPLAVEGTRVEAVEASAR